MNDIFAFCHMQYISFLENYLLCSTSRMLQDLPMDIATRVVERLPTKLRLQLPSVCKQWQNICEQSYSWPEITVTTKFRDPEQAMTESALHWLAELDERVNNTVVSVSFFMPRNVLGGARRSHLTYSVIYTPTPIQAPSEGKLCRLALDICWVAYDLK